MAADLTRVKLQPAVANTDYVNASWVPGYRWSGDNIRELSSDSSIAGATGSSSCRSTRAATRWRPSGTWCGRPGPGQSSACPPSNSRSVDISTSTIYTGVSTIRCIQWSDCSLLGCTCTANLNFIETHDPDTWPACSLYNLFQSEQNPNYRTLHALSWPASTLGKSQQSYWVAFLETLWSHKYII